jgi:hypothetical protein
MYVPNIAGAATTRKIKNIPVEAIVHLPSI